MKLIGPLTAGDPLNLTRVVNKSLEKSKISPETHHVVVVVGTPEVRTVAGAEIGFVPFWLVDPLPVEVTPEVDVERAQAAALI